MSRLSLQVAFIWVLFTTGYMVAIKDDNYSGDEGYQSDDGKEESVTLGPPPKLLSIPQDFLVREGDIVTLPCQTENRNPNDVLMWSKDEGPGSTMTTLFVSNYNVGQRERYNLLNVTDLQIRNITDADQGHFKCSLSMSKIHLNHTIAVMHPASVVSLIPSNPTFSLQKGETMSVLCNVSGVPQPTVLWYKFRDGNKDDLELVSKNNVLSLKSVTEYDSGQYICFAKNDLNTAASSPVNVVLINKSAGAVKIAAEYPVVYAGDEDVSEVACTVTGSKIKVNWLKDGQKISNSDHYRQNYENGRHVLKIAGIKLDDFGEYTCQVTAGTSPSMANETFSDVIKFSGAPVKPIIKSITEERNIPLVMWTVEGKASITNYTILYVKQDDNSNYSISRTYNNANATQPRIISHAFEGLPEGQYKATLHVENKYGISKPSDETIFVVRNSSSGTTSVPVRVGGVGGSASQLRICAALLLSFIFPIFFCF